MLRLERIGMRLLMAGALFAVGGCASVDRKVSLSYHPASGAAGGTGALELAGNRASEPNRPQNVEWIVGQVKDRDGDPTGEILSRIPPEDMLVEALRSELAAAGYQVVGVPALAPSTGKGIAVTRSVVNLQEVRSAFSSEVSSTLEVDLDLWKNGSKFRRLQYNYSLSEGAIAERDRLASKVLEESLRQMMRQAVPEIVRAVEKGP